MSTALGSAAADLVEQQRLASLELAAPRLDGYEVSELIGEGAYGGVWKAREILTGVIVAIKRLRRQPSGISREDCERLAGLSAARGIVALRRVHLESEPYCYVMEYVAGGTLAELIDKAPLPFAKAWELFSQMTRAMCYVHKDGVVHCDLKPANILLDTRGEPRISDFGQARGQGPQGSSLGTRFYMPPEQAREGQPDTYWDVYALGAILYEMLTQKKPSCNEKIIGQMSPPSPSTSDSEVRDRLEVYARHLEQSPEPTEHRRMRGVDSLAADLINRCLSLDPEARPKDAAAVLEEIVRCDLARRNKPLLFFGFLAPAMLLLLLGLFIFFANRWVSGRIEAAWMNNVVESNGAIAEAIQSSILPRFQERLKLVREAAQSPELFELLDSGPQVKDERVIAAVKKLYAGHNVAVTPRWSITNDAGVLLYNYGNWGGADTSGESDEGSNGTNYSWRGWFNAKADRPDKKTVPEDLQAFKQRRRTKAFISQPYLRVGKNQVPAINVSCPIAASDADEPIGLVAAAFYYEDFIRDIEDFVATQTGGNRAVFIVNDQKQVIYSPQLVKAAKLGDLRIETLDNEPVIAAAFQDGELTTNVYPDPLDANADARRISVGDRRLAHLESGQSLAIFVQQDKQQAWAPIARLRSFITLVALVVIGSGLAYLCVNGYALYRRLRTPREALADG